MTMVLIFVSFISLPLLTFLYLRVQNIGVRFKHFVISALFSLASIFAAMLVLKLINHKGGADEIHAFKSGMVIPFLMLSLGYQKLILK